MNSTQRAPTSYDRDLESRIIEIVTTTLDNKSKSIKVDDPLFSGQTGFDSFSLMELVLQLEDNYCLSIPDEDLDIDNFYSVRTIVTYLRTRLKAED